MGPDHAEVQITHERRLSTDITPLPRAAHCASWWDVARPAGDDAAARGVSDRRLHRGETAGRQERAVQEGQV